MVKVDRTQRDSRLAPRAMEVNKGLRKRAVWKDENQRLSALRIVPGLQCANLQVGTHPSNPRRMVATETDGPLSA